MNLSDSVATLKGVGPRKAEAFAGAGILTIEDLLYFFPRKYEDRRRETAIEDLVPGKECLLSAAVVSKRKGSPYRKNAPLTVILSDGTGMVEAIFFNGKYLWNLFQTGQTYTLYGRVTESTRGLQMVHPEFCRRGAAEDVRGILPVYPQIEGISQKEIRKLQRQVASFYPLLTECLPEETVKENRLASPAYAVEHMHFPRDGASMLQGKFRLIFEELLILETGLFYIRSENRTEHGIAIDGEAAAGFIRGLPFTLTEGQQTAWEEIQRDLAADRPMNRLVQGDVGSGKTAVAEAAMFAAASGGFQSVMMAPTELLAKQHAASLAADFASYGITTGLLCSSMKASEKRETLSRLADGSIQVLVGTHAVIQPDVMFNNLGLVITDEQHRFGVRQRSLLAGKGKNPNVLVMTATPIPRTLAVILYGDLDISQIRTMPEGRKKIITEVFSQRERGEAYRKAAVQLAGGRQIYVVAPLIEESERVCARSAEELYEELSEKLKPYRVALVHGAMKQEEKDHIMGAFATGEIDVLVSTVVIEVGINVPNAVVMIIENAERFGLAQLHQLRGRVGRGKAQSYCFLISGSESETAVRRNRIMTQTSDGFEIAEEDLKLRGPGEIFGTRQHGLPALKLSDLARHAEVLEQAGRAAKQLIEKDPSLQSPELALLKKRIRRMFGEEIRLEL